MLVSVFVLAGCNLLDMFGSKPTVDDYKQAKDNLYTSSGVEYTKILTIKSPDDSIIMVTTHNDKAVLDNSFNVVEFSSKMVKTSEGSQPIHLNRYYKDSFLYFNEELGGTSEDPKYKYNNTFEEYYSLIGENYYALENFIPCFENADMQDFEIHKKGKNFEMNFTADVFVNDDSTKAATFFVIVDENHYFSKLSYIITFDSPNFTFVNTINFHNNNDDVVIDDAPLDLASYVLIE